MWAVIKYTNYRTNVSFDILNITDKFKDANAIAQELANEEYGDDVVEGVEDELVNINAEYKYTTRDGYECNVYAVKEIASY